MTVITTKNRIDHLVVDVDQTDYAYDFRIDSADHCTVFLNAFPVNPSEYIVYGLGDPFGGYIEIGWTPSAINDQIIIMRVLPLVQQVDYVAYDKFPAETHELALDHGVMIDQQLQEELNRAFKAPPGSPGGVIIMPPPVAGYTLVWREDLRGFDNAPGEESFLSWVDRAEAGADDAEGSADDSAASAGVSATWADWANKWSSENEDVLIDDGVHPPDYSAYHWAQKAEEGGIVDIFSEDNQMMVINIPEPRYRTLEMIHGTAGGMVKLDNAALVPLENLPFSGSIRFIAPIEGHNRCPKYQYYIPDETPCVEPDTRNPSERIPSLTFLGGDYFVILGIDEEPLLNQMNLINVDTQAYEIQDVFEGDAVIYLAGDVGVTEPGWYLYPGFATGDILASDVIFDDSMTDIKGETVQEWNQSADAVIQDKVDQSGDLMTGYLDFMNGIGVRGYAGDAVTLATLMLYSSNEDFVIGPNSSSQAGEVRIRRAGQVAIAISGDAGALGDITLDRQLVLPNAVALRALNAAGDTSIRLIRLQSSNVLTVGGDVGSTQSHIYAGTTLALTLTPTLAVFNGIVEAGGTIDAPNNVGLRGRNAGDSTYLDLIKSGTVDQVTVGGSTSSPYTRIYATNVEALILYPTTATFSGEIKLDADLIFNTNGSLLKMRNGANSADLTLLRLTSGDIIVSGQDAISTIFRTAGSGSTDVMSINATGAKFNLPSFHAVNVEVDVSGAHEVDFSTSSHHRVTIIGDTTLTFVSPPEGTHCSLRLIDAYLHNITFPVDILWQNGELPASESRHSIHSLLFEATAWFGSWGDFFTA